jgi:hypothetical protein
LKPIDAEWLETQVWRKVSEALSDPEVLRREIDGYIERLAARKDELEKSIRPVEKQIDDTRERKARLANDWVVRAMSPERFEELRSKLDSEEKRLEGLRSAIDPEQTKELEETSNWLAFWQLSRRSLDVRLSFAEFVHQDTPHLESERQKVAARELVPIDIADLSLPDLNERFSIPGTRRQLLDRIQIQVVCFHNRVEIRGLLPVSNIDLKSVPACK